MNSLIDANLTSRSLYAYVSNLGVSYLEKGFGTEVIAVSNTYRNKEARFLQLCKSHVRE